MRNRSKINSDGSITRRAEISHEVLTYGQGTKSLKQQYEENKGGYARALQSGKVSEKNGKKIVTDPNTGLEYEYKGVPEKTSELTKQGLAKIDNQIDGDQMAQRRKNKTGFATSNNVPNVIKNLMGIDKQVAAPPKSGKEPEFSFESDEEKSKFFKRISPSYSQEEKEKYWEDEKKRRREQSATSSNIRAFGSAVGSAIASPFVGFSERYKKSREQEQRERGLKKINN
ncbi:MAG: hypothetical protein EBU90_01545 [Proteobacteria bacterium]|nr:hypothetical protein [Pseudomonadota bacterium]